MKLKKTISGVLAVTTLFLGSLSTLGNASAFSVETKDTPAVSGAAAPEQSGGDELPEPIPVSADAVQENGLCENVEDGAILHVWCWDFQHIIDNIDDIADAGYTAIQTSPVNLCDGALTPPRLMGDLTTEYGKTGTYTGTAEDLGAAGAWWWHYQFTDLSVGNYQLGDEEDYINMCNAAHAKGIKVITDVVFNHTTRNLDQLSNGLLSAVGIDPINRPTDPSDNEWKKLYHDNWRTDISDYSDRTNCTMYSLDSLPDINTENEYYQAYVVKYLNRLVADGCDGIRMDAVKHIAAPGEINGKTTDFFEILNGKDVTGIDNQTVSFNKPANFFIYGEYLGGTTESLQKYTPYMKLTADGYGDYIRGKVSQETPSFSVVQGSTTNGIGAWRLDSSIVDNGIVTWVESHDTYCNYHYSASLSNQQIKLAWAAIAARKDGTPLFFSRPANSGSSNYWGSNTIGLSGNEHFQDTEVVAANKFRNAMTNKGATEETLRNINSDNGLYQIDRYKSLNNSSLTCGSCIINLTGSSINLNGYDTSLADGTYTDMVTSNNVTVSNGKFTSGSVAAGKIATIYNTENEAEQEETIPDEDTNFTDYRYTYFFNSCAWIGTMRATLTDDSGSTTRTLPLTFSDDLRCYYCKYPASGYTKITFNVGSNSTTEQMISPGMVFVPTNKYNNQDTVFIGEWISIDNIVEHTIYFSHLTSAFKNHCNIYLWREIEDDVEFKNAAFDIISMTPLDKDYNSGYYNYSFSYYYPKISSIKDASNRVIDDYEHVIFSETLSSTTKQTSDGDIAETARAHYFATTGSKTGEKYNIAEGQFSSKSLYVEIAYANEKAPIMTDTDTVTSENKTTQLKNTVGVTNNDYSTLVQTACSSMSMTNVYDTYAFNNASQFEYVKALASQIDTYVNTTLPRAAYTNPASFAHPSTAFGGANITSADKLKRYNNSADNGEWVEFYSGTTKVETEKVYPNLGNVDKIKVWAVSMPRTYDMNFTIGETVISESCNYNQLLSENTQNSIKSAIESTGKTFDGWYINSNGKELKISSEPDYKYRITQSRTLYARFRTTDRPAHKATAIAAPIDVFSENGTTMYRYNTLLNICDLGDSDSNISDVGIVYVKLGASQEYDLQTVRSSILNSVIGKSTTPESITVKNTDTANIKYNAYSVTNGEVQLTTKNRLQFNLKLTETQGTTGNYNNILAFTVYKYSGTWHVSENCVHYTGSTFTEIE